MDKGGKDNRPPRDPHEDVDVDGRDQRFGNGNDNGNGNSGLTEAVEERDELTGAPVIKGGR